MPPTNSTTYGPNDAVLGRGTTIGYSLTTTGTITYIPLATVVTMDGPATTVGEVQTPLLSLTIKDYLPTLPENEVTFNIRHNGTNPATIAFRGAMAQAPVPIMAFQVTYPDASTDTFLGFPKGYTISQGENENVLMAAIPVRIKGPLAEVS